MSYPVTVVVTVPDPIRVSTALIPGPAGAAGSGAGATGPQGPAGVPGQIRFTGHGAPGTIVGANPDDTYADLDTGTVYKLT